MHAFEAREVAIEAEDRRSVLDRQRGKMRIRHQIAGGASDFIAVSPAGVMTKKNDDQLKQIMAQGYAHYHAIGTKGMRIRHIRLSPIDEHHCLAHVSWTATYTREDQKNTTINFDVH